MGVVMILTIPLATGSEPIRDAQVICSSLIDYNHELRGILIQNMVVK